MPSREVSQGRLLTRHFLRRLLDNDLISPHGDRHETLVVLAAVVTTLGLFITFFITSDYLASFDQPPGPTAMSALGDHFLYIAGSMALSALAALLVWDGLALEPRDTAILGPLPIPPRVIARAKLAAALVFGVLFTMALNAVPSVLYPAFLTVNLRGIRLLAILQLMAGHALSVVMAGVCGFFGILALRSLLRLLAGARGFERLSSLVQSTLVVGTVTAVLLAPTVHPADVRDWVSGARAPRWLAAPVLWHLAVHETVAGHVVADTPFVPPPRVPPIPSLIRQDHAAVRAYAALRSRFPPLAQRGWLSVPLIVGLSVLSFLWANRRLPERTTRAAGVVRDHPVLRELVARLTGRNPETRAGFCFALQVLPRSAPHRTIAAVSLAAGLPLPLIALTRGGVHRFAIADAPLGLVAIQTMILLAVLAGLRYNAAVPAELASNWSFRLAWRGDERGYLTGVKRAALVVFASLPVAILLPLHVVLFGIAAALGHALFGLLFAAAAIDLLFLGYRRLPFACSFTPVENPKLVWPGIAVGFLAVTYGFAFLERWALPRPAGALALGLALAAAVATVAIVDRRQRRDRQPVDFGAGPAAATQRLGLFDSMAVHD